ncbi:Phophatidylserine decarboxylase-domain-containing protein [Mycena latifolia]|nr:Phophatidylserine decarboxylase-domain-containing protein [Mycena latifolia]
MRVIHQAFLRKINITQSPFSPQFSRPRNIPIFLYGDKSSQACAAGDCNRPVGRSRRDISRLLFKIRATSPGQGLLGFADGGTENYGNPANITSATGMTEFGTIQADKRGRWLNFSGTFSTWLLTVSVWWTDDISLGDDPGTMTYSHPFYMYFTQMWGEVPRKPKYANDLTGKQQIWDYVHTLDVLQINHILTEGPEWTDAAASMGMVGVPIVGILDYAMGIPSVPGPDVKKMLKKVLNEWGKFLKSPESAYVLGDHKEGWFGETANKEIMQVTNAPLQTNHKFEDMFVYFFTRQVQENARPVASPDDDGVVVNCCESKVYNVARDAKLRNKFFIKSQPYSVLDMLAHDPLAAQFAGANHLPGLPVRAVDNTNFSEPLFEGIGDPTVHDTNSKGISVAQGCLSPIERGIVQQLQQRTRG